METGRRFGGPSVVYDLRLVRHRLAEIVDLLDTGRIDIGLMYAERCLRLTESMINGYETTDGTTPFHNTAQETYLGEGDD